MNIWMTFKDLKKKKLLKKEDFYSMLNEEKISDRDYEHVKIVWSEFEMKAMGDYHNFYLNTDVLSIADVFEQFRKMCL